MYDSVLCWRGSQNPGACWPASSAESVSLLFSENPYLKKTGKEKEGEKEEGRVEGQERRKKERGRSTGRQAENEIPDIVLCLPHAHTHKSVHIERAYLFLRITDT